MAHSHQVAEWGLGPASQPPNLLLIPATLPSFLCHAGLTYVPMVLALSVQTSSETLKDIQPQWLSYVTTLPVPLFSGGGLGYWGNSGASFGA